MLSLLAALVLLPGLGCANPADDDPAILIKLERPDLQLQRILALFEGSRATAPSAALAAWKRATKGEASLSKGAEAAIAALNPRMIPELRTLDGSTILLNFAPDNGVLRWSVCVPRDDGTLASFATAIALTDGASEPPLGSASVDRLGPQGSALMARSQESVVVGTTREELTTGLQWLREHAELEAARPATQRSPELFYELNAKALSRTPSLDVRRLGEALLGLGWTRVKGSIGLERNGLKLQANVIERPDDPAGGSAINPEWALGLPAESSAAFTMSLDGRPSAWDRAFLALDRIEKADPSRKDLSPLRVRLNLIATAARVNPERDLWPKLQGVSGFLLGNADQPMGFGLALHAIDEASAATLRDKFLPSLARTLRLSPIANSPPGSTGLGDVRGRPLVVVSQPGSTVWIAWGAEVPDLLTRTGLDPSSSLLNDAGDREQLRNLSRKAWIWPQRLVSAPAGSVLAEVLRESPTIVLEGRSRGAEQWDRVVSGDLRPMVRRLLDVIPQEPAHDPGGE